MLFHRSFGDPKKPLLVFLHGFLGSSLDFMPVIEKCQHDFFCVALDLPGHGASPYTPDILHTVKNTIEAFDKKPILVGYSMGGRLAFSLEKKMNLQAFIGISAHTGLPSLSDKLKRKEGDLLIQKQLLELSSKEFLSLWYKQPIFSSLKKDPKKLSSLLEKRRYKNKEELSLVLEKMSLAKQPLYKAFSCPSFFLYGEEDEKYKDLYKDLPSKKGIPAASHALLEESPEKVAQEILIFLQKETLCKRC